MEKFISFDRIPKFVINLDKNKDRYEKFKKYKNIIRWKAIYGKDFIGDNKFQRSMTINTRRKIEKQSRRASDEEIDSPGAIGCALSHYYLWKSFVEKQTCQDYLYYNPNTYYDMSFDNEYILVFEDDCNINDDVLNDIEKQYNQFSELCLKNNIKWDVFLFGRISIISRKIDELFQKVWMFMGMHCYLIKKNAILKIINDYDFFPIDTHIDFFLSYKTMSRLLDIYSGNNVYVYQDGETSIIAHGLPLNREQKISKIVLLIFIGLLLYIVYKFVSCKNKKIK